MACIRPPEKNKIGIIFNPGAGVNRKKAPEIQQALSRLGETISITGPADVEKALFHLATHNKNWLLVSGGDGTVQMVLTALFEKKPYFFMPNLCALPGGTTNLIAIDVGPKTSQIKAIKRLDSMIKKTDPDTVHISKRHILKVSSQTEKRYCMFIGGGLITKGVSFYEKSFRKSGSSGNFGIILTFLRYLIDFLFRPYTYPIEIKIDARQSISGNLGLFMATTLDRLLWNMRPFWRCKPCSSKMTLIFKGAKGLWWLFPHILSGAPHPTLNLENGYFSCSFSRLEVCTPSPLAVDGELLDSCSGMESFLIEKRRQVVFWRW